MYAPTAASLCGCCNHGCVFICVWLFKWRHDHVRVAVATPCTHIPSCIPLCMSLCVVGGIIMCKLERLLSIYVDMYIYVMSLCLFNRFLVLKTMCTKKRMHLHACVSGEFWIRIVFIYLYSLPSFIQVCVSSSLHVFFLSKSRYFLYILSTCMSLDICSLGIVCFYIFCECRTFSFYTSNARFSRILYVCANSHENTIGGDKAKAW